MRLIEPCFVTLFLCGTALAEDATTTSPTETPAPDPNAATASENPVEYGVGFRLRNVIIPKAELELFLERSSGGANNWGFGFDLTRRRGNVELQLGIEYEKLTVGQGVWIASGDNVAQGDEADWVLSPEDSNETLSWLTFEFTFINHAPVHKNVAIRYGGGAGIGVVLGKLMHYDIVCNGATNDSVDPGCVPPRYGGTGQYGGNNPGQEVAREYDLPPVFPVVNAILGVQFRPTDKVTINIEGGLRTLLFWGISGSYFF